jgi:hypothetical protein
LKTRPSYKIFIIHFNTYVVEEGKESSIRQNNTSKELLILRMYNIGLYQ